jgi:hypothetical protein
MDLDAYAVKSYNAMQASIAINAIDSEREGLVRVWLYICTFTHVAFQRTTSSTPG